MAEWRHCHQWWWYLGRSERLHDQKLWWSHNPHEKEEKSGEGQGEEEDVDEDVEDVEEEFVEGV
jgi:hypothetical protein